MCAGFSACWGWARGRRGWERALPPGTHHKCAPSQGRWGWARGRGWGPGALGSTRRSTVHPRSSCRTLNHTPNLASLPPLLPPPLLGPVSSTPPPPGSTYAPSLPHLPFTVISCLDPLTCSLWVLRGGDGGPLLPSREGRRGKAGAPFPSSLTCPPRSTCHALVSLATHSRTTFRPFPLSRSLPCSLHRTNPSLSLPRRYSRGSSSSPGRSSSARSEGRSSG